MASSSKDGNSSTVNSATQFLSLIFEGKNYIKDLEAMFFDNLWPAVCEEFAKKSQDIKDLEERIKIMEQHRKERHDLEMRHACERMHLVTVDLSKESNSRHPPPDVQPQVTFINKLEDQPKWGIEEKGKKNPLPMVVVSSK
ncbi:unnamed protein product [Calypogeia fissa]